jgi:hypothetical protein
MALNLEKTRRYLAEGWTLKCGHFGPWVENAAGESINVHWSAFRSMCRRKELKRVRGDEKEPASIAAFHWNPENPGGPK